MADSLTVTISQEAFTRFQKLAQLNEKQRRLLLGMLAAQMGRGGRQEVDSGKESGSCRSS